MREFMMNGSGIGQIISDEKGSFFPSDKGKDSGDHIRNKADQPSCSKKKEQEQKGADSCFYRKVGRQFCIENYLIGQFIKHGFLSNRGAFFLEMHTRISQATALGASVSRAKRFVLYFRVHIVLLYLTRRRLSSALFWMKRSFYLFFSSSRHASEQEMLEARSDRLKKALKKTYGKAKEMDVRTDHGVHKK